MNLGKETEQIEFKKSTNELTEGLKSISAILNKHGSGILYYGVKDDGEVIGQQVGKDTGRDISHKIVETIEPRPNFSVKLERTGDLDYIKVEFNGNNRPYAYDGRYYIRFHDENRLQNRNELSTLFLRSENNYSEWENELTDFTIADIDEKRVKKEYIRGFEKKRLLEEYTTVENALIKFGLLINGKITNAGIHLFGNNGPIYLSYSTYATSEKTHHLDLNKEKGNIFDLIELTESYISKNINWQPSIKEIIREDIPEIPVEIYRELIVNSFAHAKYYQIISNHEINIFSDRVRIFNPGSFPIDYEPIDFVEKVISPVRRNVAIIEVLRKTERMESDTFGLKTVYRLGKINNLTINYLMQNNGVEFNIHRPQIVSYNNIMEKIYLTKNEVEVYKLIKEDIYIKSEVIAEILKKSTRTVLRVYRSLKDKKFIERIGEDYNGHWRILK